MPRLVGNNAEADDDDDERQQRRNINRDNTEGADDADDHSDRRPFLLRAVGAARSPTLLNPSSNNTLRAAIAIVLYFWIVRNALFHVRTNERMLHQNWQVGTTCEKLASITARLLAVSPPIASPSVSHCASLTHKSLFLSPLKTHIRTQDYKQDARNLLSASGKTEDEIDGIVPKNWVQRKQSAVEKQKKLDSVLESMVQLQQDVDRLKQQVFGDETNEETEDH
jgi:hypothetical protein